MRAKCRRLLGDFDALGLRPRVGTGDPDGQHARVIGGRDGLAGDVRGQLERPAERSVPDLAQGAAALFFLRVLVAAFSVDYQATFVRLPAAVLTSSPPPQLP